MKKIVMSLIIIAAALGLDGCLFGQNFECEGAGTCDDPQVCWEVNNGEEFDAYYVVDGTTFWCDDGDCLEASEAWTAHCGF